MESFSRQQHLDSTRQASFQSFTLNNVSNTSKPSASLNITASPLSYGEILNANFRTTMVSTSSTPTPSTRTSPFYLLRDDARELSLNNRVVFPCVVILIGSLLTIVLFDAVLVAATPLETNGNLLVKHGFDQTYQKSKKVKESLSSFLPHLPGKASLILCIIYLTDRPSLY